MWLIWHVWCHQDTWDSGKDVKYITLCHEVHIKYAINHFPTGVLQALTWCPHFFFSLTGWLQRLLCTQHHHLDSKECKWHSQKGWNYSRIISRRPWHREDSWQYPRSWHKSGKWDKMTILLFIFFSFMYHSVVCTYLNFLAPWRFFYQG
jgi:hypothetical protein